MPFQSLVLRTWLIYLPLGMNGRGRKSKWMGSSIATFSVVPHLRIVFNFGGVMIPLDKLQTKWNWYSNQQDRLLASPIVHARTNTTLKVMKAICTPHHDCSPNYFVKWTLGRVAIFTNPQIYSYSEWATRGCVDEPKCNSQFLAVVTQMKHLSLFFRIMQHKFSIWHRTQITHEPWQSLQLCTDFTHLRVVLIAFYKCMHPDYSLRSRCDLAFSSHLFLPFNFPAA